MKAAQSATNTAEIPALCSPAIGTKKDPGKLQKGVCCGHDPNTGAFKA